MSVLENYLRSCGELTRFCSNDGLIDNHSLRYTVLMETERELFVEVMFDELLLDGSRRPGDRITCRGQLHLYLDGKGRILRTDVL